MAEGAFCVGLGLAGKQNRVFVRPKGIQSYSLGSTLLRLSVYNRVGGLTVELYRNSKIILYTTYLFKINKKTHT